MWKYGLKTKLVISFTLISIVTVTIVGVSTMISMRRTIEQEIQNKLLLLADAKEGQIFAYMDSLELRTLDFSSDGFIRDSLKEIIDTGSTNTVNVLNENLIKNKKPIDENIFCIMILDSTGKIIASTEEGEIGGDESATEQFIEGQKKIFVGREFGKYERENPENFLSVAAPITDRNTGESLGVIINSFRAEKLNKILSGEFQLEKGAISSNLGRSGTLAIHLINKEKKILAHGRKETKHEIDVIDTLPVQQCLNSKEEIVGEYINHFGESVIGASMCFPERGWVLLTEINTNEVLAPVRSATYELMIMLVLVLIFVVLDIYLIAGNIINPIQKLHEASDIIASGNLDYKVDIKTRDEAQELAEAFNQMAASIRNSQLKLRQYSKELEEKVAEKTEDLQNKVDDLKKTQEAVLNIAEDAEIERHKTAREKDKIDAILHSIGDGVFVVDKDLKVTLINEVAAKMAGYKTEEILGTKYTEKLKFIFEDTGKINDQIISKAIETKTVQEMTNHTALVGKAGNKIQVADSAAPLFDAGFNVIGCVVIFRDVTREREIETAKSQFVSVASHQLRTPLTSIRWLVELLMKKSTGPLNKNQKEFLIETQESTNRLIALVRDLLNVSRIETGRLKIDPKPTDLILLSKDIIKELDSQIKEKRIKMEISLPRSFPDKITTDPLLLRQVILNLLSNAIKYTPDGGKIIYKLEKRGEKTLFSISDTGIGIPKSEQSKIFERFFRASNVQSAYTDGTGLGLFMAKHIIELSGGKIGFDSAENKGTKFWFTIPLKSTNLKRGGIAFGS